MAAEESKARVRRIDDWQRGVQKRDSETRLLGKPENVRVSVPLPMRKSQVNDHRENAALKAYDDFNKERDGTCYERLINRSRNDQNADVSQHLHFIEAQSI